MVDKVTVSSHHSYGSRVGNSLKSIFWWIICVIIAIFVLVWNENNYVEEKKALEEWAAIVQEATIDQINPDLEWKEIHVSGETASNSTELKDDTFWIITDDLKLKRTVEMYQWYQESHESCTDNLWGSEDCETVYTYDKKWEDSPIQSSNFQQSAGHENPTTREYESKSQEKSPITLWVYTLTHTFIDQLTDYKTINLSEQDINIPEQYKIIAVQNTTQDSNTTVEDNNNSYLYGDTQENNTINTQSTPNEKFHILNDYIYIWLNPSKPEIWDLKITFSSVKTWTVSIVWRQAGSELTNYTASNWRSIALLDQWNVTAAEMFTSAQEANKMMTWIIRIIWLIVMYLWFAAMFKFVETIAKIIPFLSNIVWVWTNIIALWLTIVVWFLTIWIAWLAVRPVIWITCLVIAAGWIFLLVKSKKDKKENTPKKEIIEEKPEPIEEPKE